MASNSHRCPHCDGSLDSYGEMSNSDVINLRDGEVVLYKRDNSDKWQVRYKLPNGSWQRTSTKKVNRKDAISVAGDLYDNARFLHKNGMPAISKRFRDVAQLTINDMQMAIASGKGKTTYRDYIQALEKYFIPFFGSHHVDKITADLLLKFDVWRTEEMGKAPARSTINNHSGALSRVFKTAIYKGWMVETQIPAIPNHGGESTRRPAFTDAEWSQIAALLKPWVNAATVERSRLIRELLHHYVIILVFSGIRPGTEADNLKWKHIRWHKDPKTKQRTLIFHVNGKVGSRYAAAGNECYVALMRIQERFPDLAAYTFDELLTKNLDEYVFRMTDGNRSKNLYKVWKDFLIEHGLLLDAHGEPRTLYSLRHTYATARLLHDRVTVYELAEQMGTSVAMIEKYYSHVNPILQSARFAGKPLPAKYKK